MVYWCTKYGTPHAWHNQFCSTSPFRRAQKCKNDFCRIKLSCVEYDIILKLNQGFDWVYIKVDFICISIPYIYPTELQLNKANTSDKETSFLDLNIKVIGNDCHTSVYDKRDDFGLPIVNFPILIGYVPRLPSYGIYISKVVRFARSCTSVLDCHS